MSLRPSERAALRHSAYKASVDAAEGRRRRLDATVEIRKSGRDRALNEKRQRADAAPQDARSSAPEDSQASLPSTVRGLYSDDSSMQLEAMTQFRHLLSNVDNPRINEVINCGVVPRFVEFLTRLASPQLQFEAAWALTNIASGTSENTKVIVDHGAVPILVKLLSSPNEDVRYQALWTLGNVTGDSTECRDLVLAHGALFPILQQLNEHVKLSMMRNISWSLHNFCRGNPQPNFEHVRVVLPALRLLIQSPDEEILADTCWALSLLAEGNNTNIYALIEVGVCPQLVELLRHPSTSVLVPALRTIGHIVAGNDAQTQQILDHQALPHLLNLITTDQKKIIKKEASWIISNIAAGTEEQIQAVIDANIIGSILHLLQAAEYDVRKEAAWAIFNASYCGTEDQIKYLVLQGCIPPLCGLLAHPDSTIVTICLDALCNILKVGEDAMKACDVNPYAQMIEDCGGLDKVENLQTHGNYQIYEKAADLLESYWGYEDDS